MDRFTALVPSYKLGCVIIDGMINDKIFSSLAAALRSALASSRHHKLGVGGVEIKMDGKYLVCHPSLISLFSPNKYVEFLPIFSESSHSGQVLQYYKCTQCIHVQVADSGQLCFE